MKIRIVIVLIFPVLFFLSGCGGWRLTGKEFSKEQSRIHTELLPKELVLVDQEKQGVGIEQAPQVGSAALQLAPSLKLRGVGVKTLFMIKLFIAGLYLPEEVDSGNALNTDVPKDLSVKFYAKFSSKDFVNFTLKNIKPNITREEFDSLKVEFKRMSEISPDIKSGDTLALSYEPGQGTSFIHNGVNKGTIAGELFSKAIFSTWIGPKPFDHLVKRQILNLPISPRR